MDLKKHILNLQNQSQRLELSDKQFQATLHSVGDFAVNFLNGLKSEKAYYGLKAVPSGASEPPVEGQSIEKILSDYQETALTNGINPCSGRFFGYIPGGGVPLAAFGDFIAAITNRYSGTYGACPGAADIENQVIRWIKSLLEFPESAWGTLQSGGSLATVTAMIAARATRDPKDWNRGTVYFSDQTHHCLEKALKIMGVSDSQWRKIPSDEKGRIQLDALANILNQDKAQGWMPWIIAGTAGTTNTGAIDDLAGLKQICVKEKMWFHVDGAYGGFFYLTAAGKMLLSAMKQGDSVVLDPHKGLFQPYGLGIVMVRQGELLKSSLSFTPVYLKDIVQEEPSPMDYSPELTRHFRALRLWFALKYYGLGPHVACLEEKLLLAQYAHEKMQTIPGLELGPKPELSVVTFRRKGCSDNDNGPTEKLLAAILDSGVIHLSSTYMGDKMFLRMCILNFRSHLEEVDLALREIQNYLQ